MLARHQKKVKVLFGLSDILIIALAFEAAYQTRRYLPLENLFFLTAPVKALLLGYSAAVWLALGFWFQVYERLDSAQPRVVLRETFRQCFIGTAAVVLFEFALRLDLSRMFLGMFAVYSWLLLCLFRVQAGHLVGIIRREFGQAHYVMVVGTGQSAVKLGEQLQQAAKYGIRLRGFWDESDPPAKRHIQLGDEEYPVYPLSDLSEMLHRVVIDEVIFAVSSQRLAELEDIFLMCDEEGIRTRVVVDFFPHVNSDVYLDRLGPAPLLTFSAAPHDEIRLLVKRAIDFVLALAAIILLAPFMLLIAALIRLTSPGPAIFRQVRCGLNGRKFVFYKFRSMVANAEEIKTNLEELNEATSPVFKIKNDPRVTSIGKFLRKTSIDELPQLFNVLKGDMSLVGPRPPLPSEVEKYKWWQRRRLSMKPGLTCIWQVSGRSKLDFDTWMKMDLEYIDNWSLGLDFKILLKTIPAVLSGKGAM